MTLYRPVLSHASAILAHVPGLTRVGSKPMRELGHNPELAERFDASLRTFEQALIYPPHRAFIGAIHPRQLPERPWLEARHNGVGRFVHAGEVMPEQEFLALMASVDEFKLLTLQRGSGEACVSELARHPLAEKLDLDRAAAAIGDGEAAAHRAGALALQLRDGRPAAVIEPAHVGDEALSGRVLLENLAAKATATLALNRLLHDHSVEPSSIDYVLGCGEEAIGDRYQRGGGNLAKAVAAASGLAEASGADIKNFCAGPIPAVVIASSLVASGVFERVAIVAGGSLPKLGMKFQGHLKAGMPILEDVLGALALVVERDDGRSPRVRLDVVGRHRVGVGGSAPQIMEALAVQPLRSAGLRMLDVDDYATELHNPELTEPQGSGDVPARNYRTIAALAVRDGAIEREQMPAFIAQRGMPGFAPTQGHIASAICYAPHALVRLREGAAERVLLLAKGSLFLGRMSELSDGMSVLLERNPRSER
ncbi:MAG TPA: glycine/sarcosine/betaine reductase complex component C subunit beta [Solirubrobacteraceae bacterium]|nr:glycine/sarcosine/betaine reductase complex component C subunit beta [Solirubrobacteraceae bacterium]